MRRRRRGYHLSADARRRMGAARRGKHHPHRGHPMSAAARAKISAKLRGRPHPHRGHKLSPEAKAKISAALRGRAHKGRTTGRKTRTAGSKRTRTTTTPHPRKTALAHSTIRRIRAGARRGFFRHQYKVSARRKRIMRVTYRVRQRSFFRGRRR